MRCKVGDLAVVVKSYSGNEGKIVRCVEFFPARRYRLPSGELTHALDGWRTEPRLPAFDGTPAICTPEEHLRPIRDNPGADETLTWADKPERVTA